MARRPSITLPWLVQHGFLHRCRTVRISGNCFICLNNTYCLYYSQMLMRNVPQIHSPVYHIFYIILKRRYCQYSPPRGLSTIHFYIILKRRTDEPYTHDCLSTIHFYIILKLLAIRTNLYRRLSTIHFYIILKRLYFLPIVTTSLSTIHFYIILKPRVAK